MRYLTQSLTLPGDTPVTIQYPTGTAFGSIGDVVTRLIPFVFAIAGLGLLLMLISAGFSFLTSAGDAKKLEKGKQQLTYAVTGFLVIFAAYWIVQIAGYMFGITEFRQIFPW